MDRFEDLIRQSLLAQSGAEPAGGHYQRFEERMTAEGSGSARLVNFSLLRVAAVVAFGLLIGSAGYLYFTKDREEQDIVVLPPELKETLYYYENVSKNNLLGIENLPKQDPDLIKSLSRDLREYENEYQVLLLELKDFPGDERIHHAIIENQRSKAELLSYLFGQLAESKNITK
jgi:hypothetical protein